MEVIDSKKAVMAIGKRYDEAAASMEELEPGVNDDSVLEAERDTLEWVLGTLSTNGSGERINDETICTNGSALGGVIAHYKSDRDRARRFMELNANQPASQRTMSLKEAEGRYTMAVGRLQGALNMARLLGYKD